MRIFITLLFVILIACSMQNQEESTAWRVTGWEISTPDTIYQSENFIHYDIWITDSLGVVLASKESNGWVVFHCESALETLHKENERLRNESSLLYYSLDSMKRIMNYRVPDDGGVKMTSL